ncbi:hypothetical protein GCM10007854_15010 [Algimonas porphyrae]|uniref:Uncharacterized protein n=1 Tax=Algimonas porphyrae TaxID=1128113 RepID=A0ABQ5UZ56_9PROT|nr:hypothetical protein GCM10007854_15010 [Algimonas porphyrae]
MTPGVKAVGAADAEIVARTGAGAGAGAAAGGAGFSSDRTGADADLDAADSGGALGRTGSNRAVIASD